MYSYARSEIRQFLDDDFTGSLTRMLEQANKNPTFLKVDQTWRSRRITE